MTDSPDTTGAGRSTQPSPLPSPAPSFARRHPFYAAFGVLAALSLFSAFWPLSAIVTGVAVAARATGLDRRALSGVVAGGRWLVRRVRARRGAPPPPQPPQPSPAPERQPELDPQQAVRAPGPELHRVLGQPAVHRASRRQRRSVDEKQRDRALPGL